MNSERSHIKLSRFLISNSMIKMSYLVKADLMLRFLESESYNKKINFVCKNTLDTRNS